MNAPSVLPTTQHSGARKQTKHTGQHSISTPVTPIRPAALKRHLDTIGYDKSITKYLVDGFTHGFRLEHNSPVTPTEPENDISITIHSHVAQQKIENEVKAGRMKGPYINPPLPNFHVSPIKLREKTVKGTFRMIHNLSWPYDDTSINSQIPDDSKSVKYSNVNKAIKLVMRFPKGSYTRKTDIKSAFKLIPIHPDDHNKLGIKFNGKYYYDTTLPMGAGSSCKIFEVFATALQAIYDYYADFGGLSTHYLDDFFFVDRNFKASAHNAKIFDSICSDIGVPQAPEKRTTPSHATEFLGIMLNSQKWSASLPKEKLLRYTEDLQQFTKLTKVKQNDLQSIVGKLSFASAVVPARAFLRRLISYIHTVKSPFTLIKLKPEVQKDVHTWLEFLSKYNGVTFFRSLRALPFHHLDMGSDASGRGYGAVFGCNWIQEEFPQHWQKIFQKNHIGSTTLELYPVLVMIGTFGPYLRNSSILFHSDNQGVVDIVNKQSSPYPIIMTMVRKLVLYTVEYNINLRSEHIKGDKNVICDLISRFKATPEVLLAHGMNPTPTQIPIDLRSANFALK